MRAPRRDLGVGVGRKENEVRKGVGKVKTGNEHSVEVNSSKNILLDNTVKFLNIPGCNDFVFCLFLTEHTYLIQRKESFPSPNPFFLGVPSKVIVM